MKVLEDQGNETYIKSLLNVYLIPLKFLKYPSHILNENDTLNVSAQAVPVESGIWCICCYEFLSDHQLTLKLDSYSC